MVSEKQENEQHQHGRPLAFFAARGLKLLVRLVLARVTSHGGGIIIPFSVEFEEKLWALREDPVGGWVGVGVQGSSGCCVEWLIM